MQKASENMLEIRFLYNCIIGLELFTYVTFTINIYRAHARKLSCLWRLRTYEYAFICVSNSNVKRYHNMSHGSLRKCAYTVHKLSSSLYVCIYEDIPSAAHMLT